VEVQQSKIVLQQADIAVQQKQLVFGHRQFEKQQTDTQLAVANVVVRTVTSLNLCIDSIRDALAGYPRPRPVERAVLFTTFRFFGQPLM
jgi:hypothetical protein